MCSVSLGTGEGKQTAKMIAILQGNLRRSWTAQHLLSQLAFEHKTDMCFISEQYLGATNNSWFSDLTGTAAIWITNPAAISVLDSGSGEGFVWIKSPQAYYISCYLSPNEGIAVFRQKLASIEDTVRSLDGEVIVAGDLNAKSTEWGMKWSDTRGNEVADMAARLDLMVLNTGNSTTFRRPGFTETIIDIT